ncbi:hypothetical protein ARMGADRAFT_311509 [Armillaria gallica]|uniref:C2H2-type domain-containing protein n=1 Tax=Armillaria gallica TaxID=47427 RepID=A0A2H3DS42_ARMGA|nr:hypothetical protein ARMGADRAFT_311509 [Armillaria gallica]
MSLLVDSSPFVCPACDRLFSSMQGRNSHLSQAESSQKAPVQANLVQVEDGADEDIGMGGDTVDIEEDDVGDLMEAHEDKKDLYHLIQVDEEVADGRGGPGPNTQIDRRLGHMLGAQRRVLDETTGKLIRMDNSLHERWCQLFGNPLCDGDVEMADSELHSDWYWPLVSRRDWEVAKWVVSHGVKQTVVAPS